MKERKKKTGWKNDTEKLKRRDQVAVNTLIIGYSSKMEGTSTHFAAQNSH
jgi:hypothetical protein